MKKFWKYLLALLLVLIVIAIAFLFRPVTSKTIKTKTKNWNIQICYWTKKDFNKFILQRGKN